MVIKDENSWQEWNKLVIHQLDSHGEQFEKIQIQLTNIQVDIATLKIKASMWGLVAGMIPVSIALILKKL